MHTDHQLGRKGCMGPAMVAQGRARPRRSSEAPKAAKRTAIKQTHKPPALEPSLLSPASSMLGSHMPAAG